MATEPDRVPQGDEVQRSLGLTAFEASVFRLLTSLSPISVNRAAEVLGAAPWRLNGALDVLAARGAAWVDRERTPWVCGSVPLVNRCTNPACPHPLGGQSLQSDRDWCYRLSTTQSMHACARDIIERTQQMVLLDLFPQNITALKEDLAAAAARRLEVVILVYEPVEIAGVRTVPMRRSIPIHDWPGQQLTAISDGVEVLSGITHGAEGAALGVWTDDPLLTVVHYDGLLSQIITWAVDNIVLDGGTLEEWAVQRSSFRNLGTMMTPGFAKLKQRWAEECTAGRGAAIDRPSHEPDGGR